MAALSFPLVTTPNYGQPGPGGSEQGWNQQPNEQGGWVNPQPATPAPQPGYGQPAPGYGQPGFPAAGQAPNPNSHLTPAPDQPPALPVAGLAPGMGLIRVNIKGSIWSSMIVPTLLVDGHNFASQYGVNQIAVPAGPHQVSLYTQWMRQYGQAEIVVNVPAGAAVDLHYAAPWHQFTTGSIGFTKQSRKGVGCMIAILTPLILLMVLIIGGGMLAAIAG